MIISFEEIFNDDVRKQKNIVESDKDSRGSRIMLIHCIMTFVQCAVMEINWLSSHDLSEWIPLSNFTKNSFRGPFCRNDIFSAWHLMDKCWTTTTTFLGCDSIELYLVLLYKRVLARFKRGIKDNAPSERSCIWQKNDDFRWWH